MSGVIKGRGDEGQRGKERWRTEGGGDRDGFTVYYTRLDSIQEHFLGGNVRLKVVFLIRTSPIPVRFDQN